MRGERDLAFEWLNKAAVLSDPGVPFARVHALLRDLHGDTRWAPFLEALGFGA